MGDQRRGGGARDRAELTLGAAIAPRATPAPIPVARIATVRSEVRRARRAIMPDMWAIAGRRGNADKSDGVGGGRWAPALRDGVEVLVVWGKADKKTALGGRVKIAWVNG